MGPRTRTTWGRPEAGHSTFGGFSERPVGSINFEPLTCRRFWQSPTTIPNDLARSAADTCVCGRSGPFASLRSAVLAGPFRSWPHSQSSGRRVRVGGRSNPCTDRSWYAGRMGSSVVAMDHRRDVRDFLASRRARITPEQAGLITHGDTRRVKGLRREEVAMLAGVSVDYYARLERGNLAGASESALRRWHGHCSSTTPNGSTCMIWHATPSRHRPGAAAGRSRPRRPVPRCSPSSPA